MTSMSQLTLDEAETGLAEVWRCSVGRPALASTTAAEHMRTLLYGASIAQRNATASRTLHTTRLLGSARRAVELLWPQYVRQPAQGDVCFTTLQRMRSIGDAVDTGSGQWLAAPSRIVSPSDGDWHLLLGAAPADAAHRKLGVVPACAGASRFVESAVFEAPGNHDLAISPDAWFGELPPLPQWTAQVLAAHETRMEALNGLSAEQLEIYAPDVARAQRRQGRWLPAGQISRALGDVRLCRPQDRYAKKWDRPYYLAHFDFKDGALSLRRAAPIKGEFTLRLRFGFDIALQTPRRLSITALHGAFSIERPLTLPEPEDRVYALGWHDGVPEDGAEKLTFHAHAMPFVLHAFKRLSITLNFTRGDIS